MPPLDSDRRTWRTNRCLWAGVVGSTGTVERGHAKRLSLLRPPTGRPCAPLGWAMSYTPNRTHERPFHVLAAAAPSNHGPRTPKTASGGGFRLTLEVTLEETKLLGLDSNQ